MSGGIESGGISRSFFEARPSDRLNAGPQPESADPVAIAAAALRRVRSGASASLLEGLLRKVAPIADLPTEVLQKLPPSMRKVLERIPNVGEIGDSVGLGKPAVIRSPEFGESSATPVILEVPVQKTQSGMLAVGKKAHEKFFQGYPPFDFNVNFSCANADLISRESQYADPRSHWFNVFFGRYEIEAPIGAPGEDKWQRPFGFKSAGSNEIDFDDLLKIGNADWGYFSNWMYGVPEAELDRVFEAQKNAPKPICTVTNPKVTINGKDYVECVVDGALLPSAYVSGLDGKKLVNNDPLMSPVWRNIFGKQDEGVAADPAVAAAYPRSFAPTEMKMKFYLRQEKQWDDQKGWVYRTQIYGGGINKTWAGDDPAKQAYNERFLEEQMRAVRATMPA